MKRKVAAGLSIVSLVAVTTVALWSAQPKQAQAHCQVPCGIYDDAARIARLHEDVHTIEKAVENIQKLAGSHDFTAFNQATRWVQTKEDHASHIIEVVSEYFLTQKVKPVPPGTEAHTVYLKKLADHHAVMVAAMKCKQNVDLSFTRNLSKAIDAMAKHYK